ncbi:MAG: Holliday junction branch migration protein RuvA [Bacteroidota bacterium]
MIAQLRGTLISRVTTEIVIDCGGVGYAVLVSVNTSSRLPEAGQQLTILTLLITREDSMTLYGFHNEAERDAFKLLTNIGGIGPKTALAILSSVTVEELQSYVLANNLIALQKLPGIGKKTAERMIIELRDKVGKLEIDPSGQTPAMLQTLAQQEALAALVSLGYNKLIAERAIKKVIAEEKGELSVEFIIKKALRYTMQ